MYNGVWKAFMGHRLQCFKRLGLGTLLLSSIGVCFAQKEPSANSYLVGWASDKRRTCDGHQSRFWWRDGHGSARQFSDGLYLCGYP